MQKKEYGQEMMRKMTNPDKLMVEHVAMAINEHANKAYNLYMLGKDESIDLATVAINALAEYIKSNKHTLPNTLDLAEQRAANAKLCKEIDDLPTKTSGNE